MKTLFLCYKTDERHSYFSRDLIGVATTSNIAFSLCKKQAAKEGHVFDEDQSYNLRNINQTQGYAGEGEFVIEPVSINILL